VRVIERRAMPPLGHFSLIRFERLADGECRNAASTGRPKVADQAAERPWM
jgi:hypothetical protein